MIKLNDLTVEIIDKEMVKVLKNKTGKERLEIAFNMWSFAKEIITNRVKTQHPNFSEDDIIVEVARRMSYGAICIT